MQGTRGGRFGPHPVPPSLKQRNNGINTYLCPLILSTHQEKYNVQQLQRNVNEMYWTPFTQVWTSF